MFFLKICYVVRNVCFNVVAAIAAFCPCICVGGGFCKYVFMFFVCIIPVFAAYLTCRIFVLQFFCVFFF